MMEDPREVVPPSPVGRSRASLLRSFVYAGRGIWETAAAQRNFRIHLAAAVAALGLGLFLGLSPGELAVVCVIVALVLAAELINTAVEAVVDLASPQYHLLARRAKDAAAGAVLVTALGAVAVGLLLFGPPLLAFLR